MSTNAQTGENQPAPHHNARFLSRSLSLLCFVTLFLATSQKTTARTVTVDVGPEGARAFFEPREVAIQPGDTVQWNWADTGFSHSVTSGDNGTSNGLFDTGVRGFPFTFSFTFPNAGTFNYFCRPHYKMGMDGVVHVVGSTASPTPGGTAGTFGNISTRLLVETADNVLIGGFIITGAQPKNVIVRAIGPSLTLPGPLANPVLELHGSGAFSTIINDNWRSNQEAEIIATTIPPTNDLESAIVANLPANNSAYTAIVSGVNSTTGIGVVEAYDLDSAADSKLANISTRGLVQTGDDVLIGGFIIIAHPLRVMVRAIGPSLSVPGPLANPTLELRNGDGGLIASNDNWRSDQEAEIIATTIPPANDLESAIVQNLAPGNYTAIVRGVNGTTGVGLVEAYGLN